MCLLYSVLMLDLGMVCLAATLPSITVPIKLKPTPNARLDTLLRLNVTSLGTLSELPDPWDHRVPWSLITVEFYGYSDPVSEAAFEDCYQHAKADIAEHTMAGHADDPLGRNVLRYTKSTVDLVLEPCESMTWHMWAGVPDVISYYLERNGWRGAKFIIFYDFWGDVGRGSLTDSIVVGGTSTSELSHVVH